MDKSPYDARFGFWAHPIQPIKLCLLEHRWCLVPGRWYSPITSKDLDVSRYACLPPRWHGSMMIRTGHWVIFDLWWTCVSGLENLLLSSEICISIESREHRWFQAYVYICEGGYSRYDWYSRARTDLGIMRKGTYPAPFPCLLATKWGKQDDESDPHYAMLRLLLYHSCITDPPYHPESSFPRELFWS